MSGAANEGRHEAIRADVEYLREVFLFRGLHDAQVSRFLELTRIVQMPKGHVLIREGERGYSLYIIRKGEVEVSKNLTLPLDTGGDSQQEKALTRLSERDRAVFGELVLFDEETRSATVRCLKECLFYEFNREAFLKFADENVEIGYHLFKNLAQMISARLRRSSDDVIKLTTALSIALSR
jgi:CRP/FNR family transcriptional regulator, cyclic AMP receptor protein